MADELMQANEVGGIIDSLLKGLLAGLKPDFTKLDKAKLKSGVGLCLDSLKPTMSGSLDDMILDAAKTAIEGLIDGIKTSDGGHITVGAHKRRSKEEVEALIRANGGDPVKFAPFLLLLLQFLPDAIALILKILGK